MCSDKSYEESAYCKFIMSSIAASFWKSSFSAKEGILSNILILFNSIKRNNSYINKPIHWQN